MTKPRTMNTKDFYHVTIHGHNKMSIFENAYDCNRFLKILERVHEKYPFTLIAYCIMPNHYHLLIRPLEKPLSVIMASINLRYSLYYKQRYGHKGTIYDQRYFSSIITNPKHLIDVSIYIHCNPIHCKTPLATTAEEYLYSSYRFYNSSSQSSPPYLEKHILLNSLSSLLPDTLNSYKQLILTKKPYRSKKKRLFRLAKR
ncbi:transposase [Chryseomicrobium imtechense]